MLNQRLWWNLRWGAQVEVVNNVSDVRDRRTNHWRWRLLTANSKIFIRSRLPSLLNNVISLLTHWCYVVTFPHIVELLFWPIYSTILLFPLLLLKPGIYHWLCHFIWLQFCGCLLLCMFVSFIHVFCSFLLGLWPVFNRVDWLFIYLNFDVLIFSSLVRKCTSHQVLLWFICCFLVWLWTFDIFLFGLLKFLRLKLDLIDAALQSMSHVEVVIPYKLRNDVPNFIYLRHFNQQRYVVI